MASRGEIMYQMLSKVLLDDLIKIIAEYAKSSAVQQLEYVLGDYVRPNGSGGILIGLAKEPDVAIQWNANCEDFQSRKYTLTLWINNKYQTVRGISFSDLLPNQFGDAWRYFGNMHKLKQIYAKTIYKLMSRY